MASRKTPAILTQPARVFEDSRRDAPFESLVVTADCVVAASRARLCAWSRATGEIELARPLAAGAYEGAERRVTCRVFPGLDRVAIAAAGGSKISGDYASVSTWKVRSAGEDEEIGSDDFPGGVGSLDASPDGKYLAVHAFVPRANGHYAWICENDTTKIARFPSFERRRDESMFDRLSREASASCGKIAGVAITDDAFAIAEAGVVKVFALPSLEPRWEAALRGAGSMAFGPGGRVAVTTSQGKVRAFDRDGAQLWETKVGRSSIPWIVWSPSGDTVFAASANAALSGVDGSPLAVVSTGFSIVATSPGGDQIATASYDEPGVVRLWDVPGIG